MKYTHNYKIMYHKWNIFISFLYEMVSKRVKFRQLKNQTDKPYFTQDFFNI